MTDEAPPRPVDPRIAPLRVLFPNYDDLVLSSVLDSVNGDQDRAIDALLGMSDPEYKGGPAAPQQQQQPALSQTELDEQFARRLLLEDQDAQQAAWIAQQQEQGTRGLQRQQGPSSDPMTDIQQQFGKFAETGKKTFNTFFNKVKAKIHEMDQPKTTQSSMYDPAQYDQRTAQNLPLPQVPYATRPRTHVPPPVPVEQPAYYDPNPRTPSPPAQAQGYDTAPTPTPTPRADTLPTPTSTPPNDTQQRALTSPPIDGGKYGLLPKRPVTLLRPGESTQMQRQHSLDDSDDGLEYAESPFEEDKKRD